MTVCRSTGPMPKLSAQRGSLPDCDLGDPAGDGHGGPGYRVVDEPTPLLVESAGRVLLDQTVPDAGSSRLLLSRCARPDLAGAQPVIAEIVDGLDVLQSLTEGDVVRSLREVP